MAHGRIDYYVLRPSGTPDEVFHSAVSSFLLEWSQSQKVAPHTIYVVGEAASGPEAVALAAELDPDLVLLDVRMPEMGGLESAAQIHAAAPNAAIVLLST